MTNEPEFDCLELLRESNVLALPGGSLGFMQATDGFLTHETAIAWLLSRFR